MGPGSHWPLGLMSGMYYPSIYLSSRLDVGYVH